MPDNLQQPRNLRMPVVIALAVGLIFVAVSAESLAVYDACVADPACLPTASGLNAGGFIAMLVLGIVLAMAGVWVSLARRGTVQS